MKDIFLCSCGTRTRRPIKIKDDLYCVDCAADIDGDFVSETVASDARAYTHSSPKSRHDGGPGWSRRAG